MASAAALLCVFAHAATNARASSVDLTQGVIAGRIAMMGEPDGTPASADCEVRLASIGDEVHSKTYRCGTWFQPPVGRYLYWIEQQSSVSAQSVVNYGGEPFRRYGALFSKRMMPAGRMVLSRTVPLPSGAEFRLLSLATDGEHRPFDRRIAAEEARRPVRMPVGRTIAGIFDRGGNAVALSQPVFVSENATATIAPREPKRGSASLLVVLNRTISAEAVANCGASVIGPRLAHVVTPDVELKSRDRLIFVWYALAPSDVRVTVQCSGTSNYTRPVHLAGNSIQTLRENLANAGKDAQ